MNDAIYLDLTDTLAVIAGDGSGIVAVLGCHSVF
jgi:hypothetical protein